MVRPMLVLLSVVATGLLAACTAENQGRTATPDERRVVFLCDRGQSIAVRFTGETAWLEAGAAPVELQQQRVASGIAYAGGGHQLRGKGPEMAWTDSAGATRNCRDQEWAMRQPQIQPPQASLAGTAWRLVHFESSDDSIGIVVPPRAERYTLRFMPDGSLALQLDCNRATARWQATPTSPQGGSLVVSAGPMTRAMCGPRAMDTRLARDTAAMRSYTLRDGRLHIALMADAGIYVWEPLRESGG